MKKQQLTRALGGGSRPAIIEALARFSPRTVREISSELKLSYTGIKAQCIALERLGYLRVTRLRAKRGRPLVCYHLTPKARPLLPDRSGDMLISILEQAVRLFGDEGANKLIFKHFQVTANYYADTLALLPPRQRVHRLVELRSAEGRFARCEEYGESLRIVENHNPLARFFEEYPHAQNYETEAMMRTLGFELKREDHPDGRTVFTLPELPTEPVAAKPAKPAPVEVAEAPKKNQRRSAAKKRMDDILPLFRDLFD